MQWVAPEVAARRILTELFGGEPKHPGRTHDGALRRFQQSGVVRSLEIIRQWGGVLLADAVGLGKTHMGVAIARHYLAAGQDVIAVVPSALLRQWQAPLRRADPRTVLLTHAALSRGAYRPSLVAGSGLLLVDEAHAFRNPASRRYAALAHLAASRSLCLITATPVNNSIWDLYHLIRLFCAEDALSPVGVSDLRAVFAEAEQEGVASTALRTVMRTLVVRRTRADVADELANGEARFRFPKLLTPITIQYDADPAGQYDELLHSIGSLQLDAFQAEAAGLVRFMLLKRLASSNAALLTTVHGLLHFQHERLAALRDGMLLTPADVRGATGPDLRDQLTLRRLVCRPIRPHTDVHAIQTALVRDIQLLSRIAECAAPASIDLKRDALHRLLFGALHNTKVLVFTEFRDTADYLWRSLRQHGGVGLIHGSGAFLGAGRAARASVVARFAPAANGLRRVSAREAVRILIATDVLAEGLNLQDCAHVVSYDLPWNPVRIIQRVGRVDRMGSPHEAVQSYNFVPDAQLDACLDLLSRLGVKLRAIDMAVGLEHVVIGEDAAAGQWQHLLAHRRNSGPSTGIVHRARIRTDEDLRAWLRAAICRSPEPAAEPCATLLTQYADMASPAGACVIVIARAAAVRAFRIDGRTIESVDPGEIAGICVDAAVAGTGDAGHTARVDCGVVRQDVVRRYFRRAVAAADADVPGTRTMRSNASRMARAIQRTLSTLPGGPDHGRAALAEQLILGLSRMPAVGTEAELATILRRRPSSFDVLAAAVAPLARPPETARWRPVERGVERLKWRLICLVFTDSRG